VPEADTSKMRVRRVLFPKRKRTPKIKVSEKWYQKKRVTVNTKLRQVIIDAMPFSTNKEEADKILHIIFDTIADEVCRGGEVMIVGFGKFKPIYRKARYQWRAKRVIPAHYKLGFTTGESLCKALRFKEDGNTGTDQGT
jgi:nucleoid DNA-binding protein